MSSSTASRQQAASSSASTSQQHASASREGSQRDRKRTSGSSAGREEAKMIGQWRIGRTIGKGSSGRVKIAKHAITQKYAAIKIVPKGLILSSRMSMSDAGAKADKVLLGIEREIVIMKLIDHPNVLNLYDVWETSTELYLIMEYVPGGELFDYLVKRGRLPVSEALHYFQQIIHAVDYCHRFNICHRDLKPENLLLDKDKNIKVADFGMAAWEAGERMLETSCGSPHYASPEIVAGKAYHGSSSDIWSCGIILFALLTGRLPFDDDNIRALLQKVKIGVFEMPDEIKDPARSLLSRMLEKDPERRITMPEILRHPFFVSRAPRAIPGRALVSPPSLGEVERPVNSPDDIDPDIMGNLKTLWHGAADEDIIAALMSREKTWEKAIYHLLIKYRNKHLENYNMDDEDEAAAARRAARRQAAAGTVAVRDPKAPSPAKRKGVTRPTVSTPTKPRLAPLGENETTQSTPSSPPRRPQAPTPKKASQVNTNLTTPRAPGGPRPPLSPRGSSYTPQPQRTAPAITLQEATPVKVIELGAPLPPSSPVPASPRQYSETLASPEFEDAPQLPPLNVPQVQDTEVQRFFDEVAQQLNTMHIRSSVASGSSSTSGADYSTYMNYHGERPMTPMAGPSDPNQFADADDDQTEAASIHSMTISLDAYSQQGYTSPRSSVIASPVGLGIGGPPSARITRPGLYPLSPGQQANNRWSVASSGGSSQHRGASAGSYASSGADPYSYSFQSPTSPQMQYPDARLHAQRPAPAPPARTARPAPLQSLAPLGESSTLARENSFVLVEAPPPSPAPSWNGSWGSKGSSFVSGRSQDGFGMLRKKKKGALSVEPTPFSPDLSGSVTSPKRSWFNNLFSFKPAAHTLMSSENIPATREEIKRLLHGAGVKVAQTEIEGLRVLKCRLDEMHDPNGLLTVTKAVRFRVDFSRAPVGSGFLTSVTLVQEKGAMSSFKAVFARLRQNYDLDTPKTTNTTNTRGLYSPMPSPVLPMHRTAVSLHTKHTTPTHDMTTKAQQANR